MIYWQLFSTFFEVGAFTFGGGYAMLPLIQQKVQAHHWISTEDLVNFIAVSESSPGPFAVNISTYIGQMIGGMAGALCATLGVILPAFVIILLVARCFRAFQRNRIVRGAMAGLKPAVVGMIAASLYSIGRQVLFPHGQAIASGDVGQLFCALCILGAMLALMKKGVHPILIICMSAVGGVVFGFALHLLV